MEERKTLKELTDLQELGSEVKNLREQKKLKIQEVADNLKIQIEFLMAIEKGNFDFLPNPYERYFLKCYLQYLGGPIEPLLSRFDEIVHHTQGQSDAFEFKSNAWSKIFEKFKKKINHHLSLFIAGSGIFLFSTIFLFSRGPGLDTSVSPMKLITVPSIFSNQQNLSLTMLVERRTWVQLAIDDGAVKEFIYDKGDSMHWMAEDKFFLRIGNAACVKLIFNGKELPLEPKTQTISLVLTKNSL